MAPGQALAVYDLGAGTFDVAIVGATQKGFVVLAEGGLADLGGIDVDQALLEHVGRQVSQKDPVRWQNLLRPMSTGDRRAQRALREDVRAAKESLSRHPQTDLPLPEPFDDVLVTRVELEALIRPGLLRSVELLAATIRSTGLTPDRLIGIYLVGGSSRIPLIATLIAEQLRVVPTSLDQPETAVALGAHHVPQEGITMRTSDISGTIDEVQRTQVLGNRPPAFAPAGFPPPRQQVPIPPPSGPIPVQPQFSPQPVPAKPSNRKPLAILGGVVVVAVVAVIITLVATSGGASGGSGGVAAGQCTDTTQDSKGFSKCMRTLAGPVADTADCKSGLINPAGGDPISAPGATAATCTLSGGYTIFYYQFASPDIAEQNVDAFLAGFSKKRSDADSGDWQGAGLKGKYYAIDVGLGIGAMLFTVDGSPVMGTLMKLSAGSSAQTLPEYFNDHVKPGSNG